MKKIPVGIRLTKALITKAKEAAKQARTSMNAIIERGIELAAREQEKKNAR